jgi:hypothetical protein
MITRRGLTQWHLAVLRGQLIDDCALINIYSEHDALGSGDKNPIRLGNNIPRKRCDIAIIKECTHDHPTGLDTVAPYSRCCSAEISTLFHHRVAVLRGQLIDDCALINIYSEHKEV